jgi:hypothetical protein
MKSNVIGCARLARSGGGLDLSRLVPAQREQDRLRSPSTAVNSETIDADAERQREALDARGREDEQDERDEQRVTTLASTIVEKPFL